MIRRTRYVLSITALLALVVLLVGVEAQQPSWTFATLVPANPRIGFGPQGAGVDPLGSVLLADWVSHVVYRVTTHTQVLAGLPHVSGTADGEARTDARFNGPWDVAVAGNGTTVVVDNGNHSLRRIGGDRVTTWAGLSGTSGTADGFGGSARFNAPRGAAFGQGSVLYLADTGNHAIRAVADDFRGIANVTTFAGVKGVSGFLDGPVGSATFNSPRAVAVDTDGTVYVADSGNHTVRKIANGVVTTLAGLAGSAGSADGTGAAARFSTPSGVAVASGTVYIGDTGNHTIRAITSAGEVTTIGGLAGTAGSTDGTGGAALFNQPEDLSVDGSGAIVVVDRGNGSIRVGYPNGGSAPVITVQPQSATVPLNQSAQLSCGATGVPAPLYGWQKSDGTALLDGQDYTGTQSKFLTIRQVSANASYRCVVTNAVGSATSATATVTVGTTPTVTLAPSRVNLASVKRPDGYHVVTPPQTVTVNWNGAPAAAWSVSADQPWVRLPTTSGNGSGTFLVSTDFAAEPDIAPGTTTSATVTLSSPAAGISKTLSVTFTLYNTDSAPTGVFDTPADNAAGVSGSIAVTGWAIDDVHVQQVQIWRDLVAGETPPVSGAGGGREGKVFVGTATQVPGARPDVEQVFPNAPEVYRAGWGYMLLTYGLPNQGNGVYKLYAFALDFERVSLLGSKTITVDNAHATKPFGAIDTPGPGATVSGAVTNFGWALTPGSCAIPANGVQVSIDSGPLQPVSYGDARSDIAGAFPGYTNANAAGGHYTLDTTQLTNGLHTIGWIATDNCGRADGIGSRFFTVANNASTASSTAMTGTMTAARGFGEDWRVMRMDGSNETPPVEIDGTRVVRVTHGERIELQLPGSETYAAQQVVKGAPRALPIGSSFDPSSGTFSWQPAAGFLGAYELEFTAGTRVERVRVVVK